MQYNEQWLHESAARLLFLVVQWARQLSMFLNLPQSDQVTSQLIKYSIGESNYS